MPGVDSGISRAWSLMPRTPVAPGGGRSPLERPLRSNLTSLDLANWEGRVAERLGLHFPPPRVHLLQDGLATRARELQLGSLDDYHRHLEREPAEWMNLAAELTVGETSFFRQAEVLDALATTILPEIFDLRAREGVSSLRFWSAGCSTGEEAYSLAVCILESLEQPWLWNAMVTGTDLNHHVIQSARSGQYARSRMRAVSEQRLNTYFESAPDGATMSAGARLRSITTFRVHNLVGSSWPLPGFDIIVCQNVLFYVVPALRLPLLDRLYASLSPGGYLIVGPAELPGSPLPVGARPIRRGGILVYRRS